MSRTKLYLVLILASSPLLPQQNPDPDATPDTALTYPAEWPVGPSESSVPEWARPGRVRFARWDGGPIEAAKAVLSGWDNFNSPVPDYLYTMATWLDPGTIGLLRQARINTIWITFSNGFSIRTEKTQRELAAQYIDACHRQGIHVIVYQSIGNIFWEDMFQQVPESREWIRYENGKPASYGGGDYSRMGRITRYMADLTKPGWQEYLRQRLDLAIDAGADGITYDNNSGGQLLSTYQRLYQYAASRKKDFLMMANFKSGTFVFSRLMNAMTNEDGAEPGVYQAAHLGKDRDKLVDAKLNGWTRKHDASTLAAVGDGFLVTNIGLLRLHRTLSEGWKPGLMENSQTELGHRMITPLSGPRYQLALAESMMMGSAAALGTEGAFGHRLRMHDPEIMAAWQDIGRYNQFFADNQEYYTGTRSLASLAVIMDDRGAGVTLLDALAARNVLYDVIYEHDLSAGKLKPYAAVAVLTAEAMRDRAVSAIEAYVSGGGRLFAAGKAATRDEKGRRRARPAFFEKAIGKGESTYYEQLPQVDKLAAALLAADRPRVRVNAPPGVLYDAVTQPETGRVIVHLLNYTLRPTGAFKVSLEGRFRSTRLISPDSLRLPLRTIRAAGAAAELEIPDLKTYSVLVFESR